MKLAVISFTEKGNRVNLEITRELLRAGEQCTGYIMNRFVNPKRKQKGGGRPEELSAWECSQLVPMGTSLEEWAGNQFLCMDGLIFIGAAGIAVRAVAPFVKDKMTDPAVVVVDEKTQFCISLLSGHVGGANELTQRVARMTGAVPVVTTATDVNRKFAVDLFAVDHGLVIGDRDTVKRVSRDVLEGRLVGFYSDFPVEGEVPEELSEGRPGDRNIWITTRDCVTKESFPGGFLQPGTEVLRLIPKALVVGIGCRKGTAGETVKKVVEEALRTANQSRDAVGVLSSIDLKKEEPGLLEYAGELGAEFHTYTAGELEKVPGDFRESAFVTEITGVGNVCERAAMAEAIHQGGGRLLLGKQAGNGVTVALVLLTWKIRM